MIRAVDRVTGPLEKINQRLERSVGKLTAPFRRLGDRLGKLSSAAGLPKVVDGFRGVGTAAGDLGSKVLNIGRWLGGMGAVGGAAFYGLARGALEAGDRIGEISQRVGLGVDAFASLEYAAAQADVGPEAFAAAMDRFNKSLGEMRAGSGPIVSFLGKVGSGLLRQVQASGSTEEALSLVTDAFTKIEDPARRAALASALFGKSGLQMGQFLGQGSEAIQKQQIRFMELAGSQVQLAATAGAMDNAMRESQVALLGLRNAAMGALFPALTKLAGAVTAFLAKNRDGLQRWAERTGAAIEKWVDGGGMERLVASGERLANTIGRLVDALGGVEGVAKLAAVALGVSMVSATANLALSLATLGKEIAFVAVRLGTLLIGALSKAALAILSFNFAPLLAGLSAATASVWSFTVALLANPITWVVIAVGLLATAAYLLYKNWEPIAGFFVSTWNEINYVFRYSLAWIVTRAPKILAGVVDHFIALFSPLATFFTGLWDGIVSTFQRAWAMIEPIADKLMAVTRLTPFGQAVDVGTQIGNLLGGDTSAVTPLSPARALPAPGGGEARVTVDFANLPRGATVTPARGNSAPLDLNLGFAMGGP